MNALHLVGIASLNTQGRRHDIYVHAKVMLVDDEWATIGSCNLYASSLSGHTEMNTSVRNDAVVRALRYELSAGHLGQDTAHLDARAALQLYQSIARENRRRRDAGDPLW